MRIAIFGAGRQARAVLAVSRHSNNTVVGFIDSIKEPGLVVDDCPVLGPEEDTAELAKKHGIDGVVVSVGHGFSRQYIHERLAEAVPSFGFPTVVHPTAHVCENVVIGDGCIVMPGAHIIAGATLGFGCLVNTSSVVEHDCVVSDFCGIGPAAVVAGHVSLGARAYIGANATVLQRLTVGADSVIGAGAVLTHSVPPQMLAYGNPARTVRNRSVDEEYL